MEKFKWDIIWITPALKLCTSLDQIVLEYDWYVWFFSLDLARSASVNLSSSTPSVLLGGTFNLTVQFEPNTVATNLAALNCGYEIGSAPFVPFVKWVLFSINAFQLVGSGFPPSYYGRLAIANKTTLVISNVQFQDEGTRYHCELEYFDTATSGTKALVSTQQTITSVYGK